MAHMPADEVQVLTWHHSAACPSSHSSYLRLQVLDVLAEVAFEAEFLSTRIEKERRAVMAEAQMMNTIEYRVDCQLLQYLHEENALGFRFPIGKMDQAGFPVYLPPILCQWWCMSRTPPASGAFAMHAIDMFFDACSSYKHGMLPPKAIACT